MCVPLLGPDGAGKTTLAQSLDAEFPVEVRYLYSGLFQRRAVAPWRRRLPELKRVSRLGRIVLIGIRARWHRGRGRLVILDRSPHELRMHGDGRGLKARAATLAIRVLTPTPDLVILLDAPAEVLYARKGEHTVAILDQLRRAYLSLVEQFPAHVVIDARDDAGTVRRTAVEAIRRRFADPSRTERHSMRGRPSRPQRASEMDEEKASGASLRDDTAGMPAERRG